MTGPPDLALLHDAINKCVRCGYCREWNWGAVAAICPVLAFVPGWETNYARGHVWQARTLLALSAASPPGDAREILTPGFLDDVYRCTLCGSCEAHCPGEVPLLKIFEAMRSELTARGKMLASHEALEFAIPALNPDAFSSRRPIAPAIAQAQATRPKQAEVLYYPGCTTATKTHNIPNAVISIFEKLQIDYTVLAPDEESCCGLPFYEVGAKDWFTQVAHQTVGFIKQHRPRVVVTTCSGCYKFLAKVYPEILGIHWDAEIQHFSTFIRPLLAQHQDRLHPLSTTVTYHDPCTLGRGTGLYDPPREVLSLLPGVTLQEMPHIREHQLCCGAGGGVGSAFPALALQMAIKRLHEAESTQAEILVSSCAGCLTNFSAAGVASQSMLQFKDLAELVDEALPRLVDPGASTKRRI